MTYVNSSALDAALQTMCSIATRVMTEHNDDGGVCVACGHTWPCELVVLADHNLELVLASA